jgi:heme-degrading monooxygenase HmoA
MSVMVVTRVPGLTAEAYEGMLAGLEAPLRAAPGLISHAAAADADGVTVTELWQEEEDWRNFFESSVEPNLPPDVPASEVVPLLGVVLP